MLRELRVKNFLLIESVDLEFEQGLTVISGESGSGKSMLLQALEGALGRRLPSGVVRPGAEEAVIEALFELDSLSSQQLDDIPEEFRSCSSELVVRRVVSKSGKSKVSVNGALVSMSMLEGMTRSIMTIASQREHMRLLERKSHIEILDCYSDTDKLRGEFNVRYKLWRELCDELAEAERRLNESAFRLVELKAISDELNSVNLSPGVRADLEGRITTLAASARSSKLLGEVQEAIRADDGALDLLRVISARLSEVGKVSQGFVELSERAASIRDELIEIDREIGERSRGSFNETRELDRLRDELAEIARLERKYRASDAGLIELRERISKELQLLENPDSLDALRAKRSEIEGDLKLRAAALSKKRRTAAPKLARSVMEELHALGMSEATVEVKCEDLAGAEVLFCPDGSDVIEIFISTAKGSVARPIQEVASGGELARLFLAIKKVLGAVAHTGSLVFDEIDTGVSGRAARVVGEKLRELSSKTQVICITHLPQVASLADSHIVVERSVKGGSATLIRSLDKKERIEEVARMIAGHKVTDVARASAMELMK